VKLIAPFVALLMIAPFAAAGAVEWKTQTVDGTIAVGTLGLAARASGPAKDHHVITLAQVAKGGEYVNLTWTTASGAPMDLDISFLNAAGNYMDDGCYSTNLAGAPEDETGLFYTTANEERCRAPANAVKAEISGFFGVGATFRFTYAYLAPVA